MCLMYLMKDIQWGLLRQPHFHIFTEKDQKDLVSASLGRPQVGSHGTCPLVLLPCVIPLLWVWTTPMIYL